VCPSGGTIGYLRGNSQDRMAEVTYRSRIYGAYTFTAPDEGGVVSLKGKQLNPFGG
jgi:hypothetical protein